VAAMGNDLFEEARREVETRLAESPADEDALVDILALIGARAEEDLRPGAEQVANDEQAWELLAAVDAWASLASYAFQSVYAEELPEVGTPFRRFKGAKEDVMKYLRSCVSQFKSALDSACRVLAALSYSIGVQFPWGVSIGLEWAP